MTLHLSTKLRRAVLAAAVVALPGLAAAMELSSPDIVQGENIAQTFAFNAFGCTGENISPELDWSGAPEGTKSFVLMVHDPDAATGGAGFWHWVVVDIPASASGVAQGAGTTDGARLPDGARQIATDFGVPGWGGPCPPEADAAHRYDLTLYAMPVEKLDVPDGVTASMAGFMVNSMALAKATLSASYDR